MGDFIKIASGPDSYPTGGFEIAVGEYEKISNANVEMHPDTILGSSYIPGFVVSLATEKAAVTVLVTSILCHTAAVGGWGEIAAGTDLSACKFVLSGEAI